MLSSNVKRKNTSSLIVRGALIGCFLYISTENFSMTVAVMALITLITWHSLNISNNSLTRQGLFRVHNHYKTEILEGKHVDEVAKLVAESFCEDEPMTHYLRIGKKQFLFFAEQVIKKAALEKLSVIVRDGEKIVACAIVEDITNPLNLPLSTIDPKFQYIFGLLGKLSGHFFRGKEFQKDNLAHLFITAVDVMHQGRGLSKKVNFAAMELSQRRGFDFMCCEFTNKFNEQGTIKSIKHKKVLIGECHYRDFSIGGTKPFENLNGSAHAYLWELKTQAKLIYKTKCWVSHDLEEEFPNYFNHLSNFKISYG